MDRYDLMLQLPEFYRGASFAELQRVLGEMCRRAGEDLEAVLDQLWPQTASGWGLELWETAYGIPIDRSMDTQTRRSRVLSQLRAGGTATPERIRALAKALTGYDVEITEQFSAYTFFLRFYGDQPGLIQVDAKLLRDAVELVKPAHLEFIISPVTWGDLEEMGLTWAGMEARFPTWAAFEVQFYCHPKEV